MASVVPNMVSADPDPVERTTCGECGDSTTDDWASREMMVATGWWDSDHLSDGVKASIGGESPIIANQWEMVTVYECPDCYWFCLESELNNADPWYDEDAEEEQEGWKCTSCDSVYDDFAEAVRCCP